MADDRRRAEARGHIEKAEKYLKTSMFKWTQDFDSAANEYEKAAICLRNAKDFKEAVDVYVKAAQAHRNTRAFYHAAKAYEQAGLIMKDQKCWEESVQLMQKAAQLYRENGTPDTAALTLEKTAKYLETVNVEEAIKLYIQASEVVEVEDRPRQAVQSIAAAARLNVRKKNYDGAIELLEKERDLHVESENWQAVHRTIIFLVLVHLQRGDFVAADKVNKASSRYEGFAESETGFSLEVLLEGVEQQNEDKIFEVLSSPLFKFLDNDYAKLAKALRTPSGKRTSKPQHSNSPEEGIQESAEGGPEEEEDLAGGLDLC